MREVVGGHLGERSGDGRREGGGVLGGRRVVGVGDDRGSEAVLRGEAPSKLGHRPPGGRAQPQPRGSPAGRYAGVVSLT